MIRVGFVMMKSVGDEENHYCAYSYGKSYVSKKVDDVIWDHQTLIVPRIREKDSDFINKTDYFLPYEYGKTSDDVVDLPVILRLINNFKGEKKLLDGIEIPDFRKDLFYNLTRSSGHLSNNDYVFFSVFRYHLFYHVYLALCIKKLYPRCIISFGGPQIEYSELTRKLLEDVCDHILTGDVGPCMVNVLTNNQGDSYYNGDPEVPDYPFISTKLSNCSIILSTSRDCIHKCAYCPSANKHYRLYSLKYVEECLKRYRTHLIYFNDPLINPTPKRFDDLLDLLTVYNFSKKYTMWLHFWGLTKQNIEKLGYLNPRKVWVSMDISSHDLRSKMRRKHGRNNLECLEMMIDSGIKPVVPFMVGIPGEDDGDFFRTVEVMNLLNIRFEENIEMIVFPYMYIPGSQLMYNKERFDITTENWDIKGFKNYPRYYDGISEETTRRRLEILNGITKR